MAFEGAYSSLVWSDEPHTPTHDWRLQGLTLGVAAGLGGVAFKSAITPNAVGTRPIDNLANYARTAGNLSPFQVGNTFRVPEWLSPFTSPDFMKMDEVGGAFQMSFDRGFLENASTFDYLKRMTGLDDSQLRAAGITSKMQGPANEMASKLIFEKAKVGDIGGSLYSIVGDAKHLLTSNAMLLQYTAETPSAVDLFAKNSPINKVAHSVFAAMDMWNQGKFIPDRVFSKRVGPGIDDIERPKFIPIPGFAPTQAGTAYLRAMPAFSMGRFNQLLTNIGQETLGSTYTNVSRKLGIGLGVRPGPASHMYTRFGVKAAGLIGVGLAVGEMDWIRRQGGFVGQAAASAVTSFGIGALATRAGFGPRAGLFAGIASFAGQMILPGFDQGVLPGIATTWALGTEARALPINPFNYYRRTLEGFAPGISSVSMGLGIGVAAAILPHIKVPGTGQTIPGYMLSKYGPETFGVLKRTAGQMDVRTPKTIRDHYWQMMLEWGQTEVGSPEIQKIWGEFQKNGGYTTGGMRSRLTAAFHGSGVSAETFSRKSNAIWSVAEDRFKSLEAANPVNQALKERLGDIAQRYSGKSDIWSKGLMQAEGMGEQIRHSFFGANVAEEGMAAFMKTRGFGSFLGRTGLLFATGFLTQQVLTGGLFGSMKSTQELQDIYSGRQLVEIQKGRGWELGGTPDVGAGTGEFRPHWYPLMMNRVKQTGVWGPNEDRLSPTMKFFLENFTYELERRTYWDRPSPISAPAFANIPLIGPALGATIGQLIKPAKLMHSGEWMQTTDGNLQFASVHEGWRREPAYNLGAADPGIPASPYGPRSVFSDMNSQMRDLGGLTGWVASSMQSFLTGDDVFFKDQPRLADSGMMTSYRKKFWDMSLGGGGPIGEIVRRVLPNLPSDIERRNPIINNMPQWLPKEFRWGDPMSRLAFGEGSLPGAGYARLHPELKNIDPENYPAVYRYDILAQVSPKSEELRETRDLVYQQRALGHLTPAQEQWVDRIDQVVKKQWIGYEFQRADKNAIQLPGSSITQAAWFGAQELLREQAAPLEYMIPGGFRPFQKFLGQHRDMIEQYEYERMYGSPTAFWDKPFRDWIRPSMYTLGHLMGYDSKPLWRVQADRAGSLFDEMEFYKWMTLAEQARIAGDTRKEIQYQYQASNTRMGVNPQGSPLSIYWSLPSEERQFFNSFAFAQGKDRKRVLEMVPSDQVHLYQSLWRRIDQEDPRLWAGGPTDPDENYLYRQFYGMDKSAMPSPDWIGFNQDVDLRDIKVRYVDSLAADLHDYGVWEQELRKAYSQPFLAGSEAVIREQLGGWRGAVSGNLSRMFHGPNSGPSLNVFTSNANMGSVQLDYNDSRHNEIERRLGGYLDGY